MRDVLRIIALLLLGVTMVAQQPESSDSDVKARDLSNMFYSDTLPAKAPATPARAKTTARQGTTPERSGEAVVKPTAMQRRVGLKLSLLLHDASCNVQQVSANHVFRSGDQIRLQIESNVDGYLSVVAKGSSGNESMLFPDARINGGHNQVQRGIQYSIPPTDWFTFNDQPGEEDLLIVVSREPLNWLPQPNLPAGTQPSSAPVQMLTTLNVLQQNVQARDLALFEEKAPQVGAQPRSAQALIVLNTSNTQNNTVYLRVKLQHR